MQKLFKCLLISSINHEDIFIVCVWMMINTITMLIFANYLLGMDENQTSMSKTHKQDTLRSNQNEKANERKQSKRKQKLKTQKKPKRRIRTLTQSRVGGSIGL